MIIIDYTQIKKTMKPKLMIMALLCAISWQCYGQTEKGTGFAGANISFGTSKQSSSSSSLNTFTFKPRGGYFIANNLAVGLEIPLNLSKLRGESYYSWDTETGRYENSYGPKEFSFGLAAFIRKYVDVKPNFKFFLQANVLFQLNAFNIIDYDGYLIRTDVRLKGIGASVSPGFAYYLSKHLGLEFSVPVLSFFHQNYYDDDSYYNFQKTNNLSYALDNFTPNLGVNFHF